MAKNKISTQVAILPCGHPPERCFTYDGQQRKFPNLAAAESGLRLLREQTELHQKLEVEKDEAIKTTYIERLAAIAKELKDLGMVSKKLRAVVKDEPGMK